MSQLDQVVLSQMMTGMLKHCRPRCLRKPESTLSNTEKDCLAACQEKFVDGFKIAFQKAADRLALDMSKEAN